MSVKYRVQWYADDGGHTTEYKTKSYYDALGFATEQAALCCVTYHRVQAKVKGGKWKTIAKLAPAHELREMDD